MDKISEIKTFGELEQQLRTAKTTYESLKKHFISHHKYEKCAKLVALGKAYRLEG